MTTDSRVWDGWAAAFFAISICGVYWALSIAGSFAADYTLWTFEAYNLEFVLDTNFVLLESAALIPAVYCFSCFPECRASIRKFNAGWRIYFIAVLAGLTLPFFSYPGTHYLAFPWGRTVAAHLARGFIFNLFMTPFWEEMVWRGCFQSRIRQLTSIPGGIVLMSLGWTVWHGGYIIALYSKGIPIEVLKILPLTYFCTGIVLGSIFELARGSLWPCVLLHAAFNASTLVYYAEYRRAYELGSYVSELIFLSIAACILFVVTIRTVRKDARHFI